MLYPDYTAPIVALAIFGIGLSGVGWLTTRGISTTRVEVRLPCRESALLLVYLLIYAVVFLSWGMGALREAVPAGRGQEIGVLVAKLVVHVVLPAALLIAFSATVRPLFTSNLEPRYFWRTLIVIAAILTALLAVVSPSLQQIGDLNASVDFLPSMAEFITIWRWVFGYG